VAGGRTMAARPCAPACASWICSPLQTAKWRNSRSVRMAPSRPHTAAGCGTGAGGARRHGAGDSPPEGREPLQLPRCHLTQQEESKRSPTRPVRSLRPARCVDEWVAQEQLAELIHPRQALVAVEAMRASSARAAASIAGRPVLRHRCPLRSHSTAGQDRPGPPGGAWHRRAIALALGATAAELVVNYAQCPASAAEAVVAEIRPPAAGPCLSDVVGKKGRWTA